MRRIRFKPTLRQTMLASQRAMEFMAGAAPDSKSATAARMLAESAAKIPPAPKRRISEVERRTAYRKPSLEGVDIDAIHGTKRTVPLENEVIRAIKQLVAHHPKILWILRVNAGMASYEAKSGKWAPVKFHEWLRYPMPMRMPDFYGMLIDGRSIGLEAKRPDWKKPSDQREREQADFLQCIRAHGGIGAFVRSAEEAQAHIEGRA